MVTENNAWKNGEKTKGRATVHNSAFSSFVSLTPLLYNDNDKLLLT
jgi:hypothetical protein